MQKLILIRGIPGSGKTTKAKELLAADPTAVHLEADMYFYMLGRGTYAFDFDLLRRAHHWCEDTARIMLMQGKTVIVANTFRTFDTAAAYIIAAASMNIPIELIQMTGEYGSIHAPTDAKERAAFVERHNKCCPYDVFSQNLVDLVEKHKPA